ncbi:MAG: DUF4112 domain-containing protein [Pseudomonadota bacterium]
MPSEKQQSEIQVQSVLTDEQLDKLAYWLDERFPIPWTGRRIGLDGLIGLIPGIGDVVTGGLAVMIITDAWRSGAQYSVIVKMVANTGVDMVIGAIPVVGDLFDFTFKANRRNVELLLAERARLKAKGPNAGG